MSDKNTHRIQYLICALAFVGLLAYASYRSRLHTTFGYCTVISTGGFGSKARTNYEYVVGNNVYESSVKRSLAASNVGDSFIITYDSLSPKNHNPIFSVRFYGKTQIDSLQNIVTQKIMGVSGY